MKSNEKGVQGGGGRIKVLLGSRNCAPPGRLCVGPQYVKTDLKIQRARTVRRCEDIIKNDLKIQRARTVRRCEDIIKNDLRIQRARTVRRCDDIKNDLKIQRAKTVRRCENIIKTGFRTNRVFECELGSLAQGRGQWRTVVNKVMNIGVESFAGNSLIS